MQEQIANSITSQAGLIGWYRGTIKGAITGLNFIPEKERNDIINHIIKTLNESIEIGEQIWDKVKHN